jgi:hypothetical protein
MATPQTESRPTLEEARRFDFRAWVRQDAGLLLLAAVLTAIVWLSVRDTVQKVRVIRGVEIRLVVEPDQAPRIDAVLSDPTVRLDLTLNCTPREEREALQALADNGYAVDWLVRGEPPAGSEERPLGTAQDRIQWPFPVRLFPDGVEPPGPPGSVFRLSRKAMSVAPPATLPPTAELQALGLEAEITIEPGTFEVVGPRDLLEGDLVPDPIDLAEVVKDPQRVGTPLRIPLTFDGWRTAGAQRSTRSTYRARIVASLPKISALVVLKPVAEREILNDLVIALDPAYQVEITDKPKAGVQPTVKSALSGRLSGRAEDLDRLAREAGTGSWFWALRLLDAEGLPDPVSGSADEQVPKYAEIFFLPGPELAGFPVRFLPSAGQRSFPVTVRLRPR